MFGQLQIKSAYSFGKSTILINELIKEAKTKHIDALGLCDENNMYGIFEFYTACKKNHIRPIMGVEASVEIEGEIYPFILIARDDVGYKDLVRIVSDINLNPDRCISLKSLSIYKEHLYIISGSDEGIIERLLLKDMEQEAAMYMKLFKKLFKDGYYVMIQNHGEKYQKRLNERLIALSQYAQVKVVCSNDIRYLRPEEAMSADLLEASKMGRVLDIHYRPSNNQRYLKSEQEMQSLFSQEIILNTAQMMESIKASIPSGEMNLPNYPAPHNAPKDLYLKQLCIVGLKKRFKGKIIPDQYRERLKYELKIIHSMGYDDYFLIVYDYVHYAKTHHILVGPGRGSAAGSLVAYVLGITNIDPLAYDLFFERFLNPERISMPDIDIDFQDNRRDEVVSYVIEKYGQEHVAGIVTFSTYGPRVAIKDIGKVMNVPLPKLERIAKMIPTGPKNKKSIASMYHESSSFMNAINKDPALRELIGPMSIIEYLPRNISMHAAGIVLSTRPLREVVPLVIGPSQMIMTQYSKDYIEDAGLLKMDFLGLKNLTMIDYILKDIYQETGETLHLNHLPLDDQKTYDLLSRADTYGVFQLESSGMRNLLRQMRPKTFLDIVDAIALYRPGPMENIPAYLENKENKKNIRYLTSELEPILKSTYGIMIYQEQIMQIARSIAGFSLGKADGIRKAVSYKNKETMLSLKQDFIDGAMNKGFSKKTASDIFSLIERFANYGFNKSHSVAYGYVAYQLAYLKANYPLYFFASILSNEASSLNTKLHVIDEAKRYDVKILKPSINHSSSRFIVENGGIRFSLTAVKNVGYAAYKLIEEERSKGLFESFSDFLSRIENKRISQLTIDSLIDAGAFDEFETNRAYLKKNMETLMEFAHLKASLGVSEEPILHPIKESVGQRLEKEKEVLGFYLSAHPLTHIKKALEKKNHLTIIDIKDIEEYTNQEILLLGIISRIKVITDKKGNEMAFLSISDDTGEIESVCFSSSYMRFSEDPARPLEKGHTVLMKVRISVKDRLSVILNDIKKVR